MYEGETNTNRNLKGVKVLLGGLGIALLLILLPTLLGFRTVDAGEIKVVTRFGATTGKILEPGAHFIFPIIEGTKTLTTRNVIYETTTGEKQQGSNADFKDFPVDTNTSDGQRVDIYYTIRFSIDPLKGVSVINTYGSQEALVEKVVKTESRIWTRNIPREFTAETLYSGNGVVEVQNRIEQQLRPTFEANGLVLDSIGIREIEFTAEYIGAIEAKQIEAVRVETEKNIAAQAEFRKEASITEAEAQAQAQQLQRETLTDNLLEKLWIEQWNGILPVYMLGDSGTLIQIPGQ